MRPELLSEKGGWYLSLLAGLLMIATVGCQTVSPSVSPEQMASEPLNEQVLAAGDVIEVKYLYNSELNDTLRVRPDGMAALQLIGDVQVQGKTPEALQEELNRRYATELKNPSVTVTAKTLRNNKVYVGGEVVKPGEVEIPGQLTAFEAISQTGGFKTETADPSKVVVVRNRGGRQYTTVLNIKDTLSGQDVKPFYLRAGDILYVPQTGIAKVNLWVAQHINNMIPRVPLSITP